MTDALKIARERREDYQDQIALKHNEIQQLEAKIGDLDKFLAFGQELIGNAVPDENSEPQLREVAKPTAMVEPMMADSDAEEASEVTDLAEVADIAEASEFADENEDDDQSDNWPEAEDPADSIARMLASHRA